MNRIPVNLATEDELSEITLYRVLAELDRFAIGTAYRRGGFGYLRRTIRGWNRAAAGRPFIILTDLDSVECPARLIAEWLPDSKHPNLVFSVAVREVESWFLADRGNISDFLTIPAARIPTAPDTLADPKGIIVELARRSRKEIRDRIVPRRGSTAKQGPDYNGCLGSFVQKRWNLQSARANSPSLAKALDRLNAFSPVWS